MPRFEDSRHLDELAERFQAVRRVRLTHLSKGRLTFAHFAERPEVYEKWAEKRLSDWNANARLVLGKYPIRLN